MTIRKTVVTLEIIWDDEVTIRDPASYSWGDMIEDWYGTTAPTANDIIVSAHEYAVIDTTPKE
jgi:hypothetical protein